MKPIQPNYLYILNYNWEESEMALCEMRAILNGDVQAKYGFSSINIDITRSVFIKKKLDIQYYAPTIEELIQEIEADELTLNAYKVKYVIGEYTTHNYHTQIEACQKVGYAILGECEMKHPKQLMGITYLDSMWYFGYLDCNTQEWHKHDDRPKTYSNSLPTRIAKSLANIAVGNNIHAHIVDPCCGIGTVVMEALAMGYDIKGYELSWLVASNAKENLAYYNYPAVISRKDMHTITEHFDAAIIDIPYGLFTHTTKEDQQALLNSARQFSDKLVLITNIDMEDMIKEAGFIVIDRAQVVKARFTRYIFVCQ